MMYNCSEIQQIRNHFKLQWCNKFKVEISYPNIILNLVHPKPYHISNFVILFVKQYVHNARCTGKPVSIQQVEKQLYYHMSVERFSNKADGTLKKFCNIWGPIYPNFT